MGTFKLSRTQGIGLFVVITLLAIYLVINFLKGEDLFNGKKGYYTVYENVEGLTATSPVYIRGLKVGMIEDISYDAINDNFIVSFNVKSEYAIPANSIMEFYSSDLLGGKSVRIHMGDSNIIAQSGDTLASKIIPDMVSMLTSELIPVKEQLTEVMSSVNKVLTNVNDILDTNGKENLSQAIKHLNKTLANAEGVTKNLNTLSPEIKGIVENLNKLTASLGNSSEDINNTFKNLNKISANLSEADLQATINSLKDLAQKLQDPNGSVGKLLTSDSMHKSVDSLVQNLNSFIEKVSENPKKYIKISVF